MLGLVAALAASLAVADPAYAETKTVQVPATAAPTSPGVPPIATGIVLSEGATATLTASGTTYCSADGAEIRRRGCDLTDADGSTVAQNQNALAFPRMRAFSLVGKVGNGPVIQLGTGPVTVTGVGELRLGYNDDRGGYGNNEGRFTVEIDTGQQATLRYTGPTQAIVANPITLAASVTLDRAAGSIRNGSTVRFSVRNNGSPVAACTAPPRQDSATTYRAECRLRDSLARGQYTVVVTLEGNLTAGPVTAPLRVDNPFFPF